MKNIFTLFFACLMTFSVFGQTQGNYRAETLLQTSQADVVVPGIELPSPNFITRTPQEALIGTTKYDVVTNNALSNRFYMYDDGRMVATWTGGQTASAFPDRGSFYNYYDGTNWTIAPNNVVRIEDVRSGWPSYAPLGNGEVIVSHDGTNINTWTRPAVGTGAWTKKTPLTGGDTWPRVCVHNGVIHVIACNQGTQTPPQNTLYYSKSTDGGATWSPNRAPFSTAFPNFNYSPYCYTADNYVWAEPVNGIIAFCLTGHLGDLLIYKSADNGATWTKIVVWDSPVKNYTPSAGLPENVTSPGGAQSLVIDNEGKCHIVFTTNKSTNGDTFIATYYYYSWAYYWNEDMPPFTGSDPYNVFDPEVNPNVSSNHKLILPLGFDFLNEGFDVQDLQDQIVSDGSTGMIKGISMAAAGPNRMIIVLNVHDPRDMFTMNGDYYYTKVFACSYIKDGNQWKLDQNWANDETMHSYDVYTNQPIENKGWLHVTKGANYNQKDCTYAQVIVDKTGASDAKYHIFFKVDIIPGCAASTATQHNPQQGDYMENQIVVYSDLINAIPDETPPTILTSSLPNGELGVAYSQTLQASGTTPITWSIETGALPTGLTLEATTGKITGIPTVANTYTFTVKATNAFGNASKDLSITITATPPVILTTSLPNGIVGHAYDQTLTASGAQPITWEITSGALPTGLTLEATTGKITGTPEEEATYTFTVKATNEFGSDTKDLSIVTVPNSIPALETSPIKVYPNPANDILYIDANQPVQVIFYDFLGREMMNLNITEKANIDISKLPAGIYNIKMQYGNTIENRKIVKR